MRRLGIATGVALALLLGVASWANANSIDEVMESIDAPAINTTDVYDRCQKAFMDSAIIDDDDADTDVKHRVYMKVSSDGWVNVSFGPEMDPETPILVTYDESMTFNGMPIGYVVESGALDCVDAVNQVRAARELNGEVLTPEFDISLRPEQELMMDLRIVYVRADGDYPQYEARMMPKDNGKPFGLLLPNGIGTVLGELGQAKVTQTLTVASAYERLLEAGFVLWTPAPADDQVTMITD